MWASHVLVEPSTTYLYNSSNYLIVHTAPVQTYAGIPLLLIASHPRSGIDVTHGLEDGFLTCRQRQVVSITSLAGNGTTVTYERSLEIVCRATSSNEYLNRKARVQREKVGVCKGMLCYVQALPTQHTDSFPLLTSRAIQSKASRSQPTTRGNPGSDDHWLRGIGARRHLARAPSWHPGP
jgi:hypothetical protein